MALRERILTGSMKPGWLNSAVFYQIYPQSFCDSNGDGIGDINGIIGKLDYIKSLGCNAIWLNPCFVSPFNDAGYDVADYYKVAPRYGSNADLKRLFSVACKKGIRVCLDLVPGHTSIEHPWFKESCKAGENKFSNRYIWTDSAWKGMPGDGSGIKAVNGYGERAGAFITNFFWSQPALNYGFANPAPKEPWQLLPSHPDSQSTGKEIKRIMRYWLDMGASGFRVDMAGTLVKNDSSQKENIKFWQRVRRMLDKNYPDAVLISEWFNPAKAIEGGFHVDFAPLHGKQSLLPMFRAEQNCYMNPAQLESTPPNSFFNKQGKGNAAGFLEGFMRHLKKIRNRGYVGFYTGLHDTIRISVNRTQKELEFIYAFMFTVPGVPFIYYGDEIGMKYQNLPSKEGGYRRTGSRTPMQWTSGKNAGFSSGPGNQLYLPLGPDYRRLNVEVQEKNPRSLLNRVRKLTALRKQTPALQADAEFIPVYAEPDKYPLIYLRSAGRQKILVAVNPSGKSVKVKFELPGVNNVGDKLIGRGGVCVTGWNSRFRVQMQGVSYTIVELR